MSSFAHRLFSSLTTWLILWRWLVLALVAAVTAFLAAQTPKLELNTNNDIWFVEGDHTLELSDKFKQAFGNDDFVYILFESDDFFQPENIRRLGALAEVLEEEVPHLLDLTWLGNVATTPSSGAISCSCCQSTHI